MNIVFWLIVIGVLVLIWFCLSFAFRGIGGIGLKLFNDAKNEIIHKEQNGKEEKSDSER